ncbi:hypothetical protein ACJIZ3_022288 [Penstemon smallii]|uniref:C2 NT-type domain-containing protein n=1 Tax=Penstemon smallii TaxID=265156 RepID=A0ABD3TMY3_9LAMI
MFKRSEKKIKAVFKMQFQATQVPQLKAKGLMISLVPVGVGKPTVRLTKAPILDGVCTWENPIYETVKLIKEIKTGRIREKFYYVVVSTGSSKSGFLGEVSIDFADLAEATKPLNLTLPLQTSKSGAILHVTVQKLQGDSDSRLDQDNEASMTGSHDSEDLSEATTSPNGEQNGSFEEAESDGNESESRDGSLRNQMKMLERKAEHAELEVQSLRKQILKETKSRQQLSEQIDCLKEERDALKVQCEQQLKSEEASSPIQKDTDNQRSSEALQREKQLTKKLKLKLQKTEDSNSEFVLALRDLNKKLEHKNTEISRLQTKIKSLHNAPSEDHLENNGGTTDEVETLKKKIENLSSEIEVHKNEKEEIQMEVERLTLDYKRLETENKDIYSKIEQNEEENMEIQQNLSECLASLKQFKLRVASLEEEIKRRGLQHSESLNMIDELEIQVESLQNELENQVQVFEEDLEMVSKAKIEQEQRAMKAEEALRKIKRGNSNATERLQEEFNQLSAEMSLKIEENEKLAEKNDVLEELLQKAKEEYENTLLKCEEQNKGIIGVNKNSQKWIKEKEELERQLVSVRKEAEKLMQENVSMKSQMDQKRTRDENLNLEVKKLRHKNIEVKNQLVELESEKKNLKKEMSILQGDLRKKEQASIPVKDNLSVKNGLHTSQVKSLLSEVESLKERNKSMDEELKEMHGRYSEISLRFAEVEGERQELVMALRNLKNGKRI